MALFRGVLAGVLVQSLPATANPTPGAVTPSLRGGVQEAYENKNIDGGLANDTIGVVAPEVLAATENDGFQISTFFWNTHWQCSMGLAGSSSACKDAAAQRAVDLALGGGAEVAVIIELVTDWVNPLSMGDRGMKGWAQVDGKCPKNGAGDALSLAFKPGWKVKKSGGGCLRTDNDARAFAVARVEPPNPVRGCPELCVMGIHAPHTNINTGGGIVADVCGAAKDKCTIAMGDWNVPAEGIAPLWAALTGGGSPNVVVSNERTCCFPEAEHFGVYDHLATSIAGASDSGHEVHPYQVLGENPVQQHRPVTAKVVVPRG